MIRFTLFAAAALLTISAHAQQVTVAIQSQGTQAMKLATGYSSGTATLIRLTTCNNGDGDTSVANSRLTGDVIPTEEGYSIYESDVVAAVITVLQQKDIFTRASKIVAAGKDTATLLTALFRTLSPLTITILQAAPAIAAAILPAAGDPRDLAALSQKLIQDNGSFALGKKGSGNDCRSNLAVAMAAASAVKIAKVSIYDAPPVLGATSTVLTENTAGAINAR